jgi:hypothetical protein
MTNRQALVVRLISYENIKKKEKNQRKDFFWNTLKKSSWNISLLQISNIVEKLRF